MILPTFFTPFAASFESRATLLALSGWYYPDGGGVQPSGTQQYRDSFKWQDPLNWEDGRRGRRCAKSHAWFPGHMLREVDGQVYGEPFAPKSYPEEVDDELLG